MNALVAYDEDSESSEDENLTSGKENASQLGTCR